jgi:hypothetical protein
MTLKEKFKFYSAEANKLRDFCKVSIVQYKFENKGIKNCIKITDLNLRTGEHFKRLRDFAKMLKDECYFGVAVSSADCDDCEAYTEFDIEDDNNPNEFFYVEIDAYYF